MFRHSEQPPRGPNLCNAYLRILNETRLLLSQVYKDESFSLNFPRSTLSKHLSVLAPTLSVLTTSSKSY